MTAVVAGGPVMMATVTTTAAAAAGAAATTMLGARLQQLWRQKHQRQRCLSSSGNPRAGSSASCSLFRWPLPTQPGRLPVLATATSAAGVPVYVPVGKQAQQWRLRCISEPLTASTSCSSSGGGATGSG
jgi:hypothetical protein